MPRVQEVARLEAEKSQLMQQKEAVFSSREALQERVGQLKEDVQGAAAAIDAAEDELVDLVKQVNLLLIFILQVAPLLCRAQPMQETKGGR